MNILFIDTSNNQKITVGLRIDKEEYTVEQEVGVQKAQVVLPLIDKLLNKHTLTIKDVSAIKVNTGPGSFTGLRVGIAVANTLAWVLDIPVND